jgi:hypothetical protein
VAAVSVQKIGGFNGDGTPPFTSLKAQTVTGPGFALNIGSGVSVATVQITNTGSPSAFSVNLQACDDDANYVNVGSAITAVGLANFTSVNASYLRLYLNSFTGGTAPTFTGIICAE